MEEKRIVLFGAAILVVLLLLLLVYPLFLIIFPVLFALLFHFFRLQQTNSDIGHAFFDGFLLGGHRGSPHSFPENSMAGFEQAKKEGADLIEFDLALSKDGVAVLMHDDDLDRTTNLDGPIKARTLKELEAANLAIKFTRHPTSPVKEPVVNEKIPTLESAIQWSVKNKIRMLFDVKDFSDEMVAIIIDLFKKYQLHEKAIVCSFYPWVVYKVKKADPNIITGLTWRQHFLGYSDLFHEVPRHSFPYQQAAEVLDRVYLLALRTFLPTFLGADLLLTNEQDINTSFITECREKNLRVAAWTVNDIAQAHWMLTSLRVPILTDFPYYSAKLERLSKFAHNDYQ